LAEQAMAQVISAPSVGHGRGAVVDIAQPQHDAEPVPEPLDGQQLDSFSDSAAFIRSRHYNPDARVLTAQQMQELDLLLAGVQTEVEKLSSLLRERAYSLVRERISLGLAELDLGGSGIDRLGDKELRLFVRMDGVSYIIDFGRNEHPLLDEVIFERDHVVQSGHELAVNFFSVLPPS
jgi:hypothetical protein